MQFRSLGKLVASGEYDAVLRSVNLDLRESRGLWSSRIKWSFQILDGDPEGRCEDQWLVYSQKWPCPESDLDRMLSVAQGQPGPRYPSPIGELPLGQRYRVRIALQCLNWFYVEGAYSKYDEHEVTYFSDIGAIVGPPNSGADDDPAASIVLATEVPLKLVGRCRTSRNICYAVLSDGELTFAWMKLPTQRETMDVGLAFGEHLDAMNRGERVDPLDVSTKYELH